MLVHLHEPAMLTTPMVTFVTLVTLVTMVTMATMATMAMMACQVAIVVVDSCGRRYRKGGSEDG